jgi:uncharacterized protein (DUF488 family)
LARKFKSGFDHDLFNKISDQRVVGVEQQPKRVVYTIGYRAYSVSVFLGVLDRLGVTKLVDVRSIPYGRRTEFDRPNLALLLRERYIWKGRELGGKSWPDKPVGYAEGLTWLEETSATETLCIMCMESEASECHRGFWIGADLELRGIRIVHLGSNGKVPKKVNRSLDDWR